MTDKLKYMQTGNKLEVAQKVLALLQQEIPEREEVDDRQRGLF